MESGGPHYLADLLRHLQQVISQMPSAVYVCEAPTGIIRLYNRRAVELWGREPRPHDSDERFCGSFRLFRPDGRVLAHADTPMADALRAGSVHDEDVVIERPDGSRVPVHVNIAPLRDPAGEIIAAINMFQDVTERRRAEESAARLSAIVASADDAIISKTLDGIVMSWNRAAQTMFGYTEAEMVGQPITTIIPAERRHEEDEILARLKRGEAIEHFETERRTRDGRTLSISLTVSPVRAADGRIIGASKIARDVTEQKRAEAEMLAREQRARGQAEAANQAKNEFLAMLAHELRNPLSVIANAVAVLDHTGDLPARAAQPVVVIQRQAEHLARLLDDLLDVARITSGRIELDHARFDLRSAIELAAEAQQHRIDSKRQRLAMSLPGEAVTVLGDIVRIQQVVGNLLNNASKYTPAGGSIRLTLAMEAGDAVLSVADSGAGIPPDRLDAVFELFVQANPTLARSEGGLGIGLTLVKRVVELHGGSVVARSEGPDRGTDVMVRLPLATPAGAPSAKPTAPAGTPSRRILVIEDNDDGREMLVTMLRVTGHQVVEAATGREGLVIAAGSRPEVVLLDIGLPDINGYDLGLQLRQILGATAVVVAITGYGQPQDRARSEAAGFDAHLVKPVDITKLAEILQKGA